MSTKNNKTKEVVTASTKSKELKKTPTTTTSTATTNKKQVVKTATKPTSAKPTYLAKAAAAKKSSVATDKKSNIDDKKRKKPVRDESESDDDSDENYYNIDISDESNSEDDYEDDSNSDASEDDSDDFNEINVEFDIAKMEDNDYHSIKNMMTKLVPWTADTKFSAGDITDLILEQCKQCNFGRAIRVEHNDDPYGFTSVLNHNKYKTSDAIQAYTDYIELKAKQPESQHVDPKIFPKHKQISGVLSEILSNSKKNQLGLFFSERFLNIPHQLVHPLHQFIQWDVELLVESKNNEFKFSNYLFLTTFGIVSGESTDEFIDEKDASKLKQQRKLPAEQQPKKFQKTDAAEKKEAGDSPKEGDFYYMKPEDEYLRQYASAWSTFNIPYEYGNGARWTLECNMNRKGLIMVVPQSNMTSFLNTIIEKLQ